MSVHMKTHHTNEQKKDQHVFLMSPEGDFFRISLTHATRLKKFMLKSTIAVKKAQEKFEERRTVPAEEVFRELNEKYTKRGALLKGLRHREDLTQKEFASKIGVTQGDLSKMENGKRLIGKVLAKKIGKMFEVNYQYFL